jgi:N-acetylmuramoyl-L-alanine amidase
MHLSPRRLLAGLALTTVAVTGCATASSAGAIGEQHSVTPPAADHTAPPSDAAAPIQESASATKPLAGKVIGIDPGHNGDNNLHTAYISRKVWNGREEEDCDTTGTATNAGYTEALFNWRVAKYLVHDLHVVGAKVVLTRHSTHGFGPCITKRARVLNHAHAAVSIDIHADGADQPGDRGFAILEPVADGPNDHVIRSSERFGRDLKHAMRTHTSMPVSNYDGVNGFTHRDDLAGLNLTTEPKVLVEVGNMRDSTDAHLLISSGFQKRVAAAIAAAIVKFVG